MTTMLPELDTRPHWDREPSGSLIVAGEDAHDANLKARRPSVGCGRVNQRERELQ